MPSERRGGGRLAFKLSEYLDALSYPVGTAMSINFKRLGRDMDPLFLEDPAELYRLLAEVYGGDESSALSFLRLLAASLTERSGLYIDPVEFAETVRRGDREMLSRILEATARAQRL